MHRDHALRTIGHRVSIAGSSRIVGVFVQSVFSEREDPLAFGLMAAFDISDNGVVIPLIVFGVAIWLALIRWTHSDARRRLRDPRLVRLATALAVLPLAGPVIYMILRPSEFLEDAYERDISIASSEKLIEVLAELQSTQREIHASVKHLEHALHASRRRAAAQQAAQARSAEAPPAGGRG